MSKKETAVERITTWMFERQQPAKIKDVREAFPDLTEGNVYQALTKLAKAGVLDRIGTGEYVYADPQPVKEAPEGTSKAENPVTVAVEPEGPDKGHGPIVKAIEHEMAVEAQIAREMQSALELQTEKLGRLVSLLQEAKGL